MNNHSNFGFVSITLTFVMLCLTTFLALTLITARSDYMLSKKVSTNTKAYYEAKEAAYEKIDRIDKILYDAYQADSIHYLTNAKTMLYHIEDLELIYNDEGTYDLAFKSKIDDSRYINVEIKVNQVKSEYDSFYSILSFNSCVDSKENDDYDKLNLIE